MIIDDGWGGKPTTAEQSAEWIKISASNWEIDEGEEDSGPSLADEEDRRAGNVYARLRRIT
jgi:hypothetical protein